MQTIATPRTRWIGRWVMTVAALHMVVGLLMFQAPLMTMVTNV